MSEPDELLERLRRTGRVTRSDARLTALSGGVSSDIWLVEDGPVRFVVKRALPKLRVKDDWTADVRRNTTEREYLECVSRLVPDVVPRVLFADSAGGCFGMEYLDAGFENWKRQLLDGRFHVAHAQAAGRVLGEIHRRTTDDPDLRAKFDTTENFHQLRTAPYLLTTGESHPALREFFVAEARRIERTRECLVHGDFSPKNILVGPARLVLLDCEVAWYGDPAFDVAFLLNHFFLKRLYHAPRGGELAGLIAAFWRSYVASNTEASPDCETRVARLLPLLLLARVDGKSPVEYLDTSRASQVRVFACERIPAEPTSLDELVQAWFAHTRTIAPISPLT